MQINQIVRRIIKSTRSRWYVYAKILGSPLSDKASVYFSPQEILQSLTRFIEAKQTITLEEKLIIKPDYGFVDKKPNEHTVTTGDLFCIVINPGANLILERGGRVGNIAITVEEGSMIIPCNPDIQISSMRRCLPTSNV